MRTINTYIGILTDGQVFIRCLSVSFCRSMWQWTICNPGTTPTTIHCNSFGVVTHRNKNSSIILFTKINYELIFMATVIRSWSAWLHLGEARAPPHSHPHTHTHPHTFWKLFTYIYIYYMGVHDIWFTESLPTFQNCLLHYRVPCRKQQ